jgi:hypothetical protein
MDKIWTIDFIWILVISIHCVHCKRAFSWGSNIAASRILVLRTGKHIFRAEYQLSEPQSRHKERDWWEFPYLVGNIILAVTVAILFIHIYSCRFPLTSLSLTTYSQWYHLDRILHQMQMNMDRCYSVATLVFASIQYDHGVTEMLNWQRFAVRNWTDKDSQLGHFRWWKFMAGSLKWQRIPQMCQIYTGWLTFSKWAAVTKWRGGVDSLCLLQCWTRSGNLWGKFLSVWQRAFN